MHELLRILGDITGHHEYVAGLQHGPPQFPHRIHRCDCSLEHAETLLRTIWEFMPLPAQSVEHRLV
jgi:hypothetical protein